MSEIPGAGGGSALATGGWIALSAGAALAIAGLVMLALSKVPGLGRLPGDIAVTRPGFSFHFPIVTCLVISLVATLILNLVARR